MIRLVTLDLYATLCYSAPSRNERLAQVMCELGYPCRPEDFLRPNVLAEELYTRENGRVALHTRTREEQEAFYASMYGMMLREAGLRHDDELAREVRRTMAARQHEIRYRLYDDVVPTLEVLRARGLRLGVVSNTAKDVTPLCTELGVCDWVDFVVSSCVVGCEKPGRLIFETALGHVGVEPGEALHVGDQPRSDALGAQSVGMHALLLDRDGMLGHEEYERIRSLAEVPGWINWRAS